MDRYQNKVDPQTNWSMLNKNSQTTESCPRRTPPADTQTETPTLHTIWKNKLKQIDILKGKKR